LGLASVQFLFVIGLDAGQLGYSLKTEGNGPVIDFEITRLKRPLGIKRLRSAHSPVRNVWDGTD
jgi:hypothetical protein